jgi:hypothetical protein
MFENRTSRRSRDRQVEGTRSCVRSRRPGEIRCERDSVLQGAYRAAIDKLHALTYRIKVKPETHVIGLPAKQTAAPPAPEPPQRTLQLGPVIVKARKPRPR